MWFRTYNKNSTIFTVGDPCKWFYFVLDGTVHTLQSDSMGNRKIANLYNENQLFGYIKIDENESIPERNKEAVTETLTSILMFDVQEYEKIKRERVLSSAETKIAFLKQYIPGFRSLKEDIIHEFETLFEKERATKGYRIIDQGVRNDHLYFILSGECQILYNYKTNKKLKPKFDSLDVSLPGLIKIGKMGAGD
jgi:CRP-like cAMP-binding protein